MKRPLLSTLTLSLTTNEQAVRQWLLASKDIPTGLNALPVTARQRAGIANRKLRVRLQAARRGR